MKPHTEAQLDGLRGFVDSQVGEAREIIELNGVEVEFSVIHIPEAQKPFPYAVAAAVVERADGSFDYVIAVSDDVPEELRGLWAWHEYHDFAELGAEAEDRCFKSEEVVVDAIRIDPELLEFYVEVRSEFYSSLALYMQQVLDDDPENSPYSQDDVEGALLAGVFLSETTGEAEEDL
jgi:hypothetical protein